jgi:small-conductance mechanosensitive channel
MSWDWLSLKNLSDVNTLPGKVVLALIVIVIAVVVSIVLTKLMQRSQRVAGRFGRRIDETVLRYLIRLKSLLIFAIALLVYIGQIPGWKNLFSTLLAGAGVTALVLGFAAQGTLANLVSGIGLVVFRPFRIGDRVTIEGEYGSIEDMTLRHTVVRTWENKRVVIPNKNIDDMTLFNHSLVDRRILCRIDFGVSYDTDIDLARRLILEEIERCPHRLIDADEPRVRVTSHGDFSIGLRAIVWVADMDASWDLKWWLMEHVKKRFDAEGVEIPFPYRTLVYKNDLPPARREEAVAE